MVNPRAFCYSLRSSPPYMGSRSANRENWHVDFVPEPHHRKSLIWVKRPPDYFYDGTSKDTCIYPRNGAPDYGYGEGNGGTTPPDTGSDDPCGDIANTCTAGIFHGHPRDTALEHRWSCRSVPGRSKTVRCSKPRSEDGDNENLGRCGDTADTCAGGDIHPHPPDTDSEIIWTCRNRGETYTMSNGRESHSGEITCAASKADGTVRAVDNGYTGGR